MGRFHLSCPYTSLPVCHCSLYAANSLRTPMKPARENPLRRSLLLSMLKTLTPPPGASQAPSPKLTRSLYHRAMHGKLPYSSKPPLSAVMKASDNERAQRLVEALARLKESTERVQQAGDQLRKFVEEERDRYVERRMTDDSADEVFSRRRAAAKRTSRARQKQRR